MLYDCVPDLQYKTGERSGAVKSWMKVMQDVAWLTQLGVSVTAPPLLCAGAAWWLSARAGLPAWVMLPALLLGFGGSAASVWGFYRYMQRKATRKKAPPAFNRHL